MVDSGNTWRCVCSVKFLDRMGMTLRDLQAVPGPREVATAKKGINLRILGEFRLLHQHGKGSDRRSTR